MTDILTSPRLLLLLLVVLSSPRLQHTRPQVRDLLQHASIATPIQLSVSATATRDSLITARMPQFGLYPVPRNHLYSASSSAPRPRFNTMSFAEPESEPELEPAPQIIEEAAHVVNDLVPAKPKKHKKKHSSAASGENEAMAVEALSAETNDDKISNAPAAEEKKSKKKKKSLSTATEQDMVQKDATSEVFVDETTLATEGTDEPKVKKKRKKHSLSTPVEDLDVTAETAVLEAPPTTTGGGQQDSKTKSMANYQDVDDALRAARKSAKKRKRVNYVEIDASLAQDSEGNDNVMLGGDWLKQLQSSAGNNNNNDNFDTPQENNKSTEAPAKKKVKTKRKSGEASLAEPQEKLVINSSPALISKPTPKEPVSKKRDAETKEVIQSRVLGLTVRSDRPVQKKVPQASSPFVNGPRNTPIPLPPTSSQAAEIAIASPQQKMPKAQRGDPDILVTETPPKKLAVSSLRQIVGASTVRTEPKEVPLIEVSSTTVFDDGQRPASVPVALLRKRHVVGEPSSQTSLTASNLDRYTQPLSDETKPRPRGARSVSVSSASSMSIKDAFARQHKQKLSPISVSDNEEPFFTPSSQKKIHSKLHQKSSSPTFNSAFQALLATINMTNEQAYLAQHLEIRASNDAAGPLPCLKSATGCNSKAEEHIRVLKENTTNLPKIFSSSDENQFAFDVAVAATFEAEKFLHNAVVAGVPIPADDLEGTYTLYCPKYVETHVDKYGYGLRQLTISKPSGFTGNTYTARLSIPPRPMAYTVLSFDPPPNASFRATKLTTSAEAYTMDLVILGNGYILLRVDVGLFLTGKATIMGTNAGREICMEFVGVKDQALKWQGLDEDVKIAREKDVQRIKQMAEKEAKEKTVKDEAWEKRKEEMKKEKEKQDATPKKGVKVEQSPKKTSNAVVTKAGTSDKNKEEEAKAWEKRKAEMRREKMRLEKERLKAGTMAGVAGSSEPIKKTKAMTGVELSSSPIKKATAKAKTTISASPSPKKRGRPSNAELARRAAEKEAEQHAKA